MTKYQALRGLSINEISLVSGESGVSHNGTFRGKDLGTISSLNEYIAFRSAHGIDDKSYKDLYLGDYFKIQDGTYNAIWMVAHFDYYYNKGDVGNGKGVVLIPRTRLAVDSKMNPTTTTEGSYASCLPHTTTCPAIANALSTVLGSYLLTNKVQIGASTNSSIPSMSGANFTGATVSASWASVQCILPSEMQVYGSTICSSSMYDVGEANEKLAGFNFINILQYGRELFWLRDVGSSIYFAVASDYGSVAMVNASYSVWIRPLIYIG